MRKIVIATALISLAALILLILFIVQGVSNGGSFFINRRGRVCTSLECHRMASKVLGMMNSEVDPCENYEEFVCGGYRQTKHSSGDEVSVQQDIHKDINAKLEELLTIDLKMRETDEKVLQLFQLTKKFYIERMSWGKLKFDEKLKSVKHKLLKDYKELLSQINKKVADDLDYMIAAGGSPWGWNCEEFLANQIKKGSEGNLFHFHASIEANGAIRLEIELKGLSKSQFKNLNELLELISNSNETDIVKLSKNVQSFLDDQTDWLTELINNSRYASGLEICLSHLFSNPDSVHVVQVFPSSFGIISFLKHLDVLDILKDSTNGVLLIRRSTSFFRVLEVLKNDGRSRDFLFLLDFADMYLKTFSAEDDKQESTALKLTGTLAFPVLMRILDAEYFSELNHKAFEDVKTKVLSLVKQRIRKADWIDDDSKRAIEMHLNQVQVTAKLDKELTDLHVQSYYKMFSRMFHLKQSASLTINILDLYSAFCLVRRSTQLQILKTKGAKSLSDFTSFSRISLEAKAFISFELNRIYISTSLVFSHRYTNQAPKYLAYSHLMSILTHEYGHIFHCREWPNIYSFISESTKEGLVKQCECIIRLYADEFRRFGGFNSTDAEVAANQTNPDDLSDNFGFELMSDIAKTLPAGSQRLPGFLAKFSPPQIFLISSAQLFCSKRSRAAFLKNYKESSHAPASFRINVTAKNSPAFAEVFNCRRGAPMNNLPNTCPVF